MEWLNQFHFLRPIWLLAIIPALVSAIWLIQKSTSSSQWSRFIAPNLLKHLLDQKQIRRNKWPVWGALVLWILASLALAGPSWNKIPQPVEQTTEALVICWDLSPSMLSQDIAPSRLQRSRLKIIDLLKSRNEGLFALVAYSGEAYNVVPLTDDIQTIINLLPALSPTYLPTAGSNPEMAFDNAEKLLADAGAATGNIVFITDGIATGAHDYLIDAARKSPYQLTLWTVGTEDGAPIPLPSGGFAKTSSGDMVIPKLDEQALQKFAAKADAYYVPMVTTDNDIKTLKLLLQQQGQQTAKTEREFDQWLDRGQFLTILLLPFVALLFRRGWVFGLLISLSFGFKPETANAFSWQDLWLNQNQQAEQAMQNGSPEAAMQFTSPERRGSALFEQQKYQQAASQFDKLTTAEGFYNRGTALTHAGEYANAIAAFDKALAKRPDFSEAAQNKAIAEQLLEQQRQQQNQQNQQNQNGDQNDQQGDQQSSEETEGDNSDSQQGQQNQNPTQGDPQNQSDSEQGKQQGQQDASDQNPGQAGQQDPQNAEVGEHDASEENPYSQMNPTNEEGEEQSPEQAIADGEQDTEEAEPQKAQALRGVNSEGENEEQQQLEVMLRKVPDDPGGLLREKFRYQYMQRKQDPNQALSDNEAENRW